MSKHKTVEDTNIDNVLRTARAKVREIFKENGLDPHRRKGLQHQLANLLILTAAVGDEAFLKKEKHG